MLRLANFFMRLEARLSYALIGLVQATGYAGGLDAFVVIKVNISVDQIICFPECIWFVPIETFCLQNRKEIFCHCVVVRISFP